MSEKFMKVLFQSKKLHSGADQNTFFFFELQNVVKSRIHFNISKMGSLHSGGGGGVITECIFWFTGRWANKWWTFTVILATMAASQPFKPQNPHTNSPNWSLYISFKNELREFDKRSRHFPLGDHFINSHNLISWHCMDIVRRKLTLVTIGT